MTLGVRDWRTPAACGVRLVRGRARARGGRSRPGPEPEWRPLLARVRPGVLRRLAREPRDDRLDRRRRRAISTTRSAAAWIRRAVLATVALVAGDGGRRRPQRPGRRVRPRRRGRSPPVGRRVRLGPRLGARARRRARSSGSSTGSASTRGVREFFERLREGGLRRPAAASRLAPRDRRCGSGCSVSWCSLRSAIAIVSAIRRLRPPSARNPNARPTGTAIETALQEETPATPARVPTRAARRRRPALVRRVLLALGARALSKAPSHTPSEFEPAVAEAYPSCADAFHALTRAYEDVRYGSLRMDRDALDALDARPPAGSWQNRPGRPAATAGGVDCPADERRSHHRRADREALRQGRGAARRGPAGPDGTVLGLLGPNGAGKTTTVRILTTLLHPDKGRADRRRLDAVRDAEALRHGSASPGQYAAVDENLTGLENLEMVGRLYHLPGTRRGARAAELLERFELAEAAPPHREDLLGRDAAAAGPRREPRRPPRRCSSSTSRRPASTRGAGSRCGTSSASS